MIIKKIPLTSDELPFVIDNSFTKLNPNALLLGFLENKNKLRSILTPAEIPVTTELEKNVIEVLGKSVQSNEQDEKESQISSIDDVVEEPEPEITENSIEEEPPPEIPKQTEHHHYAESEYEDEDEDENDKEFQDQLVEERNDILWSLKKLKRYCDNSKFPHFDEFTSTTDLKRILKEVKREAILDENVNQTRQYITMLWFALEKVCTEYLSIDLSGFTAYETQHMNDYQKVLVEIGERSYLNWSEGFPPELKLVYLMLTHAALFHVKKNSKNFSDFINIIDSKNHGEMRGPSKIF
jgi:hypothetical protein